MAKSDATPQTNKPPKDAPLFMWAGGKRRLIKSYLPPPGNGRALYIVC